MQSLISWLSETGKDREDFNNEAAVLLDRKPGEARSKARGAPARENQPDRFAHLFLTHAGNPDFLILQRLERTGAVAIETNYKINSRGKITKAWKMKFDVDESGRGIETSGKIEELKLTKAERKVLESDLDFWLARAKQDSQKQTPTP